MGPLPAKIRQFLPPSQPPLVFTARGNGDLSSQCWNPGLCCLAWGWDLSLPKYPSRVNTGLSVPLPPPLCTTVPPLSVTPPLLPAWMNVASLNPWLSDFHTVQFSVSSHCFLFLNWLLSLWLCKERKCVDLRFHLAQKSSFLFYCGKMYIM